MIEMDFKTELKKYSIADVVAIGIPEGTIKNWRRKTNPIIPCIGIQNLVIDKLYSNSVAICDGCGAVRTRHEACKICSLK